jgi:hypothetical protein
VTITTPRSEIPLATPSAVAQDRKLDTTVSSQVAEEILPHELNADYNIPDVPDAIVINPTELSK